MDQKGTGVKLIIRNFCIYQMDRQLVDNIHIHIHILQQRVQGISFLLKQTFALFNYTLVATFTLRAQGTKVMKYGPLISHLQ